MSSTPIYALDSFAMLSFFRAEMGGGAVRDLLEQAAQGTVQLVMSTVNLGEVVYRIVREHGMERTQEALARMSEYPIQIIDVDREMAIAAAYLKGIHRISYADCIVAILGQRLGAAVVTGDADFQKLAGQVAIEWLPGARR